MTEDDVELRRMYRGDGAAAVRVARSLIGTASLAKVRTSSMTRAPRANPAYLRRLFDPLASRFLSVLFVIRRTAPWSALLMSETPIDPDAVSSEMFVSSPMTGTGDVSRLSAAVRSVARLAPPKIQPSEKVSGPRSSGIVSSYVSMMPPYAWMPSVADV